MVNGISLRGANIDSIYRVIVPFSISPSEDCEAIWRTDRPVIEVTGRGFQDLIDDCIESGSLRCTNSYFNVPMNCWNVSNVDDMRFSFYNQATYNDPLGC